MATNKIKPFATDPSANVLTDSALGERAELQTASTTNGEYPILLKAATSTSNATECAFKTGVTVNPSMGTLSATVLTATSDARVKEVIEEVRDVDFSQLHTYRYTFKSDKTKTERVGLLAQEVQQVIPEAVIDNSGTLALDYNAVVSALVAKVNQLEERIIQLEDNIYFK